MTNSREKFSLPGIIDVGARYLVAARRLRDTGLLHVSAMRLDTALPSPAMGIEFITAFGLRVIFGIEVLC